ncbi:MAG: transposase [Myxococcales bacterium]|nr:transposase [Myxococcales bacterium]MCB9582657.1 transposase [Polyangiaceae bacterium]
MTGDVWWRCLALPRRGDIQTIKEPRGVDSAGGELRGPLHLDGATLAIADRFYPSTRRCSACGTIGERLDLGERTFHCGSCGHEADRDENAAVCLAQYPRVLGQGDSRACTNAFATSDTISPIANRADWPRPTVTWSSKS